MTVPLSIVIALVVLAPLAVLTTAATRATRSGRLRWDADRFQVAAPMVGRLFTDDADQRRVLHDIDAIRTRFEQHPSWPGRVDASGVRHERR